MKIGINKVIRILISSDFLLQTGWGFIGPIFAIFLVKNIGGVSLSMIGFTAAIYWVTKSIFQPFIAYFFDVKTGEKDDFYCLIGGMYLANLIPLGYLFSNQIWHILFLEFIRGLAMAFVIPSWSAIFTRHIDKGWEAFTWSIESTSIGLALGFSAAFGGLLATIFGFNLVFILTSLFGLAASSLLFLIRPQILSKNHFVPHQPSEKGIF